MSVQSQQQCDQNDEGVALERDVSVIEGDDVSMLNEGIKNDSVDEGSEKLKSETEGTLSESVELPSGPPTFPP